MTVLSRRSFLAGMPAFLLAQPLKLTSVEEAFLDDLSRRSFRFFWEQANPNTGLVRDRALADSAEPDPRDISSVAATGFGLAALAIGAERRWISPAQARERALAAIRFYAEKSPHEQGWFYHFVDLERGERRLLSEVSSIDSILLLAGMLTIRGYFQGDAEIDRLVRAVWARMDFRWMLDGEPHCLSMGWMPETGFLSSRWDQHCELGILYLLGIGSPQNPLPPEAWYAWRRPIVSYNGHEYVSGAAPLFVHQYSQAWIDFRGRKERRPPGIDWFENSVRATLAHRQFCLDLRERFPDYEENIWGITASESPWGYTVWGGPPATPGLDGTVAPCAAAGSLMLAPEVCVPAVMAMHQKYGHRIYKCYGFVDAFHPRGWTAPDVLGIDVGITLLSAENLRAGSVWRWFHSNPEVEAAMRMIF